jgi:hypothetical protein
MFYTPKCGITVRMIKYAMIATGLILNKNSIM